MSVNDFIHLMPLLILTVGSLVSMLVISAWRNHKIVYVITAVSFVAAFASLFEQRLAGPYFIEPLFIMDGFSMFYIGLMLLTALLISMLSYAYFEQREERKEEYYILLILSTLGACVMVISTHFASFFLGLEILSVALYSLIAYLRTTLSLNPMPMIIIPNPVMSSSGNLSKAAMAVAIPAKVIVPVAA